MHSTSVVLLCIVAIHIIPFVREKCLQINLYWGRILNRRAGIALSPPCELAVDGALPRVFDDVSDWY